MISLALFSAQSVLSEFAKLHPALIHVPIAAALLMPVALLLHLRAKGEDLTWIRTAQFLAWMGLLGGVTALASGFLWGKKLGFIAHDAWLAHSVGTDPNALQSLLRTHQLLALGGAILGLCALWSVRRARSQGREVFAFLLSGAWALAWGMTGFWGGRMVFPETLPEPPPIEVSTSKTEPLPKNYRTLFLDSCASCHGPDGSARSASGGKMFGRDIANAKWQARRTDLELARSILDGKGNMPSFKDDLSEAEAQALVLEIIRPMAGKPKTAHP